jgi:hypothetical protein
VTARIIWIEPVKRPDGRNWYSEHNGLLLRTRLDGPDGEILCDRVHNPVCESARALMARGITGPFETRKPGIPYACMTGDIEKTGGLTVYEPDDAGDPRPIHFRRWRPFDAQTLKRIASQNGPCGGTVLAPAREDNTAAREEPADTVTYASAKTDQAREAAE